jgi:hypothetical protein
MNKRKYTCIAVVEISLSRGKSCIWYPIDRFNPGTFYTRAWRTLIFNERCERHVESVEKYYVSCVQMTKDGIGS